MDDFASWVNRILIALLLVQACLWIFAFGRTAARSDMGQFSSHGLASSRDGGWSRR